MPYLSGVAEHVIGSHCGTDKSIFLFICLKTDTEESLLLPGQSVKEIVVKAVLCFILTFILELEDRNMYIQKQPRAQKNALMPPSHAYQPKHKQMTGDLNMVTQPTHAESSPHFTANI